MHPSRQAIRRFLVGVFGLALALPATSGAELVVCIPGNESANDPRSGYFNELLALALEKTRASEGPFRIEVSPLGMLVHGRGLELLKRGERIDLLYTMTSIERERDLLPIRIPLDKGVLGYRIFIIRREDAERFAAVRTLEDLRHFTAGQGHRWPDVDILRANGIAVEVGRSYAGLFEMLKRGRFEFFPRGVTEAWNEAALHKDDRLMVEPTLMLVYPTALYFFVNRANTALAQRIERGLRLAHADGSFDRLFDRYYGATLERTRIGSRRIFHLHNPILPPETPLAEKNLWYDAPDS